MADTTPYDVRQATETEPAAGLTAEDAPDSDNPRYVLGSLEHRLVAFLRNEPDVADVQEVGDGIYGFSLAGTGGISLTISLTQ